MFRRVQYPRRSSLALAGFARDHRARLSHSRSGQPQFLTLGSLVHFLLFYEVVSDYAVRRGPLRAAHLAHGQAAVQRGELILGGALANPIDGAVLLFRGDSPAAAEAFAAADPYVLEGLVARWSVREWTTVVGPDAAVPLSQPKNTA